VAARLLEARLRARIRRSAGLGRVPEGRDPDTYEHFHAHVDVLIAGGGLAGPRRGARRRAVRPARPPPRAERWWGGRAGWTSPEIDGTPAHYWIEQAMRELRSMPNVRCRLTPQVSGVFDHGYVLACEQLAEGPGPPPAPLAYPTGKIVSAIGAIERPLAFPGNDIPGVMLASRCATTS
jgi:sarcosine oxidase subunit alpha